MRKLKVLVACEFSGVVRDAFIREGFDAVSCDLLPTESPGPHIQGNVLDILDDDWDLLIAHPPCTYLANSGASWLYKNGKKTNGMDPERWMNMLEGAKFFKTFLNAPIPHIAVENPIMHGHAKKAIGGIKQSQTIQPYEYGHPESKRTCLWLKGLPLLTPTKFVELEWVTNPDGSTYKDPVRKYRNQTPSGQNKLGPSPDRWKLRSVTYQGIADAMAAQWGEYLRQTYAEKENQ